MQSTYSTVILYNVITYNSLLLGKTKNKIKIVVIMLTFFLNIGQQFTFNDYYLKKRQVVLTVFKQNILSLQPLN